MTMKWKILSSLVLLAVPAILVSASYEDENEGNIATKLNEMLENKILTFAHSESYISTCKKRDKEEN